MPVGTARGCVQGHPAAPRQAAAVLVSMQSFEQSTKTGLCGTDFLNSFECSCSAHVVGARSSKELNTQRLAFWKT